MSRSNGRSSQAKAAIEASLQMALEQAQRLERLSRLSDDINILADRDVTDKELTEMATPTAVIQ